MKLLAVLMFVSMASHADFDADVAMALDLPVYTNHGLNIHIIGYDQVGQLVGQVMGNTEFYRWQPDGNDYTFGVTDWDLNMDLGLYCSK